MINSNKYKYSFINNISETLEDLRILLKQTGVVWEPFHLHSGMWSRVFLAVLCSEPSGYTRLVSSGLGI